ncbi:helix-turn-helix domain-containing protein, partial [Streptomyces sp. 900105755]
QILHKNTVQYRIRKAEEIMGHPIQKDHAAAPGNYKIPDRVKLSAVPQMIYDALVDLPVFVTQRR